MAWKNDKFKNEESLKISLKNNANNIYILFGDDGYLKNQYKNKLIRTVCEKDDIFNYQFFDSNCDLQDVYDAVLQFPMMNDKKCVVLDDYDFEDAKKEDFEKLCLILRENPDSCLLILSFEAIDCDYYKSAKFDTICKEAENNGGIAVKLSHRSISELAKMLVDGAKKRGCNFESNAARYLVETAGQDINILVNELEKLCCFSKGESITKQTVDEVAVKTVEAKIFDLSEQIANCKTDLALKTIDELFFMRVEPIVILSTVSSFYVDMYRIFISKKKGLTMNEIIETFSYKTRKFALEKAQAHIEKFNSNKFSLSFEALFDADKKLKSFSLDAKTVIEQCAIKLCYIVAKGEAID